MTATKPAYTNSKSIAIVTGAGSGIGASVAKSLASRGHVVVIFDYNIGAAKQIVAEIQQDDGEAFALQVDVSNEQSVSESFSEVVKSIGVPSMLCNSAAIQRFGRTDSFDFAQWQQVININLNGTFLMCKAMLPHIEATQGRVVNIASLAGKIGIPYSAAYSASKGGVITFTKALAKEYADREVCISAVTPGAVDTPMLAIKAPEDINPKVLGVIPRTARAPASPQQIASLIVFLLTQAPYSMTGAIVPIDGGSG